MILLSVAPMLELRSTDIVPIKEVIQLGVMKGEFNRYMDAASGMEQMQFIGVTIRGHVKIWFSHFREKNTVWDQLGPANGLDILLEVDPGLQR